MHGRVRLYVVDTACIVELLAAVYCVLNMVVLFSSVDIYSVPFVDLVATATH